MSRLDSPRVKIYIFFAWTLQDVQVFNTGWKGNTRYTGVRKDVSI